MRHRSLLVVAGILAFASVAHADPINAVIGDLSWTATRGGDPELADEVTRIRTHLAFVRDHLAGVSVPAGPRQQRRRAALEALDRYIRRGEFPRRTSDPYAGRRPRFIDDAGAHCAVGYLIAASGAPELARAIADEYEYAFVGEIASPALVAWAETNGFTLHELAMIQPSYDARPTPEGMRRELVDARDRITLACARDHTPASAISLRIIGDRQGRATAMTSSSDPFARCFARLASQLERGGGAYNGRVVPYSFDVKLELTSPRTLFERRISRLAVGDACRPRPGPIPSAARVVIRVTDTAVAPRVRTSPANAEVARCLEDEVARKLRDFAGIEGLGAERRFALGPWLTPRRVQSTVAIHARGAARACREGNGELGTITVTVSARRNAPDFTIAVTPPGEAGFAACVREKLGAQLRTAFAVSRQRPDGRYERYFRIDRAVRTSTSFTLQPARRRPPPPQKPRPHTL